MHSARQKHACVSRAVLGEARRLGGLGLSEVGVCVNVAGPHSLPPLGPGLRKGEQCPESPPRAKATGPKEKEGLSGSFPGRPEATRKGRRPHKQRSRKGPSAPSPAVVPCPKLPRQNTQERKAERAPSSRVCRLNASGRIGFREGRFSSCFPHSFRGAAAGKGSDLGKG